MGSQPGRVTPPPHHGEFHRTAFRTSGTLRTMSASSLRPTSLFHPGIAAMYACTGASPSPFGICGLPPERSAGADSLLGGHRLLLGRLVGHGVHSTTSLPPLAKAKGCVQCVEIAEGPAARSVGSTRDAYGQGNNVPIAVLRHHSHQGSII